MKIARQVLARRGGYTLIEFLVVLGIVAILAAILFPVVMRPRHADSTRSSCQSNLKQIGLCFMQYTQDYNDKFVPVVGHAVSRSVAPFGKPYGWADAIQPYGRSTQLLQCPSEATREAGVDATKRGFTDYWMNERLSRAELNDFASPAQTILCGDGNDGTDKTNARYCYKTLRRSWLKDGSSPARRHLDTMNILFADGHVKALQATRLVNAAPQDAAGTFAPGWRE